MTIPPAKQPPIPYVRANEQGVVMVHFRSGVDDATVLENRPRIEERTRHNRDARTEKGAA